jgi:predicted RNA-binding protein with PIN domain
VAVVFDGKGPKPSNESEPNGIKIFYSKSGQTADAIIERLAAKYAPGCEVTVATDDHLERLTTESFGAVSISSEQLLDEIRSAGQRVRASISRLGKQAPGGRPPN